MCMFSWRLRIISQVRYTNEENVAIIYNWINTKCGTNIRFEHFAKKQLQEIIILHVCVTHGSGFVWIVNGNRCRNCEPQRFWHHFWYTRVKYFTMPFHAMPHLPASTHCTTFALRKLNLHNCYMLMNKNMKIRATAICGLSCANCIIGSGCQYVHGIRKFTRNLWIGICVYAFLCFSLFPSFEKRAAR